MNEYSILMNLLSSRASSDASLIGATEDQLCDVLGYSGRNKILQLNELLTQFSRSISPFGLILRQNPFNKYWFLTQTSSISEILKKNPLDNSARLGATLCTILLHCLSSGKSISVQELQELRGKKNIQADITELINKQFILQDNQNIKLHPNIGYYLDLDQFLEYMENQIMQLSHDDKLKSEKKSKACSESPSEKET